MSIVNKDCVILLLVLRPSIDYHFVFQGFNVRQDTIFKMSKQRTYYQTNNGDFRWIIIE